MTASDTAIAAVRAVRARGREDLVMVLGNGCCESTAPYLFDHHVPEPGSVAVGDVDGIAILAPAWLARMYADDEHVRIDAEPSPADDSLSLETDLGLRFRLA